MTRRLHTATTLLAGLLLAACTQDTEDTATRAVTGETVPLQFALSLGAQAATRMAETIVQKDGNFRGIEDIKLIPFSTSSIDGNTTKIGDFISLELLLKPTPQNVANSLPNMTSQNTALYKDVNIPVGTSGFLFYGKAKSTSAEKHVVGQLNPDWNMFTTPSDLTFSLETINGTETPTQATALATYMTNIANASVNGTAWKDYMNTTIKGFYTEFIKNIAGSSNSIRALLQDLYTNLNTNYSSDEMAKAIIAAIATGATNDANGALSLTDAYANYPAGIGLPDGAAYMKWDAANFSFVANPQGNIGVSVSNLTDYVYPPCLYYRVNSGIKTSTAAQQNNYTDTNDWTTITGKYTDGTSVDGSTKSVAITDPIQYAVGRFDMTVKCNAATLLDNTGTSVTVPTGGFPVTAVFVAGQKPVDWEFKPKNASTADDRIVYDNQLKVYAGTTASDITHTLVLETAENTAVTVAVELENTTGLPFTGNDGQMIYAGSKFYLVGQLTSTQTPYRVFEQDKTTRADFTIQNLKKAYNVIPDLRAPHLELGISIISSWSSAGSTTVPLE